MVCKLSLISFISKKAICPYKTCKIKRPYIPIVQSCILYTKTEIQKKKPKQTGSRVQDLSILIIKQILN